MNVWVRLDRGPEQDAWLARAFYRDSLPQTSWGVDVAPRSGSHAEYDVSRIAEVSLTDAPVRASLTAAA